MSALTLRRWQESALSAWERNGRKGIVSVVTGGGKTIFALACVKYARPETVLIVVPTIALLDQWWDETADYLNLRLDDINILSGAKRPIKGTVNIAVLNTAAKLRKGPDFPPCMLIVDECHKAATEKYRAALDGLHVATLGLSATPERQYDDGLNDILVPALGPVIFTYDYKNALDDGVIVPFELRNVIFDLENETQAKYNKLSRSIAQSINKNGLESSETVALMLRRARVMNLSLNRIRLTLRIIASHRDQRILVFHEDIAACDLIYQALQENDVSAGVYHSKLPLRQRAEILHGYRQGKLRVLVTCRALDEGFNVPETEIGIVAASTATRRQRIQRLGRILRPAKGKETATVYTLVATKPEIDRLRDEEENLEGVAGVSWSKA